MVENQEGTSLAPFPHCFPRSPSVRSRFLHWEMQQDKVALRRRPGCKGSREANAHGGDGWEAGITGVKHGGRRWMGSRDNRESNAHGGRRWMGKPG